MYCILDIDLDYFAMLASPVRRLQELLDWGGCPVSFVVEQHNQAFARWRRLLHKSGTSPSHILHVDEHHDMMDERKLANIANFMYHAMHMWPRCRVHWLVQDPIDCPSMWLREETWSSLRRRFSRGPERPASWPRPDLVSVCTSPDFIDPELAHNLLLVVQQFTKSRQRKKDKPRS
jgi:hypothetical protein